MKSWYYVCDDVKLKDGTTKKEHRLIFVTDNDALKRIVEKYFQILMDEEVDE